MADFRTPLHEVVALPDHLSARDTLSPAQQRLQTQALALLGLGGLLMPVQLLGALMALFWVFFFGVIIWRIALILLGARLRFSGSLLRRRVRYIDAMLPVYSILLPAYHERGLMPQLAQAMSRLDWPASKLDILILTEADDPETAQAAFKAFGASARIIVIPPGGPRTKPEALRHGLRHARGRYLAVYDAEDRPACGQLRAAYLALERGGDRLACVQAPLRGSSQGESLIGAQWALEYAVHFALVIPALARLGLPIAIGGTSNHFRVETLRRSGGWDGYNVTEDADLGLRLARLGYRVGTIAPPTREAPPQSLKVWLSQRTRWIKGYAQTWLVLMRHPRTLLRELGVLRFVSLQLTLGGAILAPFLYLPMLALLALTLILPGFEAGSAGWSLFFGGVLTTGIGDLCAPGRWGVRRCVCILLRPIYWPLHTIAAWRALIELVRRPHYWAKTPHTPLEDLARP